MSREIVYHALVVAVLATVGLRGAAASETEEGPFVAGFDRFARHGEIDPDLGGRLLLSELSCTACHAAESESLQPKRGPRLDGVADRLSRSWMKRFLWAPQRAKPGTTMPDLLAGVPAHQREQTAEALIAFLATQHEPFPELRATGANPVPYQFWDRGDAQHGKRLYHQIGCVACHEPDERFETADREPSPLDQMLEMLDVEELAEMGLAAAARPVRSIPHADLQAKYSRKSLTFFLIDPAASRPSGRMPNLKLTAVEAADIAAYLLQDQRESPVHVRSNLPQDRAELIEKGRQLFAKLGCVNCHTATRAPKPSSARLLADLNIEASNQCIGASVPGLPHFTLDQRQKSAIQTAVQSAAETLSAPAQRVELRMLRLNCYACHQRDRRGGVGRNRRPYFETVGHVDLGDEGRIPPMLDGVGRKLTTSSLEKVLQGNGDVRPHMVARMPKFSAAAVEGLPALFARSDRDGQREESQVFGDRRGLAEPGRAMLDTGCVQCHPIGGESLPGVVGIDLETTSRRIRPGWFHDFLLDPSRLRPRTRMPTFFPDGQSQDKTLLDGDVERQIAAVWTYLKEIGRHPLPEKIQRARSQDFELKPDERPILLRTFMEQAGTQAIAVGFPEKVHFAFDAEKVRLAQAWRGRYLDAQGTWFVRSAPPAKPLGKALIEMPAGVPFAILSDPEQDWPARGEKAGYRFRGYRLDRAGIPTFLYRIGQFTVEDRIAPNASRGLTRSLEIKNRESAEGASSLWFRAHAGKSLDSKDESTCTNEAGLSITVSGDFADSYELPAAGDAMQWIVRLDVCGEERIEVQYQW